MGNQTGPDRRHGAARALGHAEAWIFDLDNTLYPASCDLFAQIDKRMQGFIARFLGLDLESAFRIQKKYFREHGTTLRGLMDLHGLEPTEFLDYVHDIDLSIVPTSPDLDTVLDRLPGRKFIFTNASADHARRVMTRLGVSRHFDEVFDIICAGYVPKPDPRAYSMMIERYGLAPRSTVMVEDIARNLAPAAALGMTTVWLRTGSRFGEEGSDGDHVHHVVDDLVGWLKGLAPA